MYGKKEDYNDAVMSGAITPAEVERCRRNIKIGDFFMVKVMADKGEQGKGKRENDIERIKEGRVTAKYRHLVTLDCGILRTSITYVQILQRLRNGRGYID